MLQDANSASHKRASAPISVLWRCVLTHLRRMVLKINFLRLVKNKSPEEEIKAYNWHFNFHKELPRPPKRRADGLFRRLHRAKRIKNHASSVS